MKNRTFSTFFFGHYIVTVHLMIGSCQPFENAHPKALQRDLRSWDEASRIHGQPVEKEEDISTMPSLGAPGILRAYHGISETVSRSQRKNIIGLKDIFTRHPDSFAHFWIRALGSCKISLSGPACLACYNKSWRNPCTMLAIAARLGTESTRVDILQSPLW